VGVLFHAALIVLLSGAGILGLEQASLAEAGPAFLLFVFPFLLVVVLVPYLFYRIYALWVASYILERDGIRLRWGLRAEDIPMDQVLWAELAADLEDPLPLPWLRWPGNLVGVHRYPDGTRLEFMAAQRDSLIVIATEKNVFAISPRDAAGFLKLYRRLAELGSLTPLEPRSVYPTILVSHSWSELPARILMLAGALLSLILLAWVSLAIPQYPEIAMRLTPSGSALDTQPAFRLMLLPVVNAFFFLADLLLGLFFFRRAERRPLAFLLWVTGSLTPILFMGAVFLLLRAS
jgi:hypothetical protein